MDKNKNSSELSNSILLSVRKLLPISEDDDTFDFNIMMHINAAASTLFQLGVLVKPYTVTSIDDTYKDMMPNGTEDIINQVKMYFYYKVQLGFDNSTLSSSVIDVIKEMIKEAEWRLMISFNPKTTFE